MSNLVKPDHIPISTYRVQLRADGFGFEDAASLVQYLNQLGIGCLYLSPLFRARSTSTHGYDVVDHGVVEPRFGGELGLTRLSDRLEQHGMGLLLDLVPNHMGIDDPHNQWWNDVLVHGEGSRFASYFDIDWDPPVETTRHSVLLPILGDYFGSVLERQELTLQYDKGRFWIAYYDRTFPVAPATWAPILRLMLSQCGLPPDDPSRMELESIIVSLDRLPASSDRGTGAMRERYRESEVATRRLRELVYGSRMMQELLDEAVTQYNGVPGQPLSFDRLEQLLQSQSYRLAYWRVAGDEINYRRFFDINELAAIRVEKKEVFEAVHALSFRLLAEGRALGLRIDHPDGLFDPPRYFQNLQDGYRQMLARKAEQTDDTSEGETPHSNSPEVKTTSRTTRDDQSELYVVVEKILARDEHLDPDWPVHGTTGYEFLNAVNALFIAPGGANRMRQIYERFTGVYEPFRDVIYDSKRAILDFSMSSELNVLARMLARIAGRLRSSRDFTLGAIERALREVVASFAVYRTYIRPGEDEVRDEDRRRVQSAVRLARRHNPEMPKAIFDFLSGVLLLEDPIGLSDEQRDERRRFVLKLQQVTGPVMAKGLEDTAFYRYYPLASFNEVGGEPDSNELSPEELHRIFIYRRQVEPYALSATATHDMKRGEDVRARLNALSEVSEEWEEALGRWRYFNASYQTEIDGVLVPDPNETYLIYQTLIGTWPGGTQPTEEYVQRMIQYCEKAFREAKLHTSWLDPDSDYESAIFDFVRGILNPERSADFLSDLDQFTSHLVDAGYLNGLAQLLIKIAAPGVPDFYQGCECWDFRLVDPDNRGAVDFVHRQSLLENIQNAPSRAELAGHLLRQWPDESLKMFVTWTGLQLRERLPELFLDGEYLPLPVTGERKGNLFAFARRHETGYVLAMIPRLTHLAPQFSPGRIDPEWWEGTNIELPEDAPTQWRNLFTDRKLSIAAGVTLADWLSDFPLGFWIAEAE